VSDPEGLIGPVGAAALDAARHALEGAGEGAGLATLRVAGWTRDDWAFRFELAGSGRHLVVHVPHDGSPAAIREAGPGPDPLTPGGRGAT
jgi:hypothetical protein